MTLNLTDASFGSIVNAVETEVAHRKNPNSPQQSSNSSSYRQSRADMAQKKELNGAAGEMNIRSTRIATTATFTTVAIAAPSLAIVTSKHVKKVTTKSEPLATPTTHINENTRNVTLKSITIDDVSRTGTHALHQRGEMEKATLIPNLI
ncbi:hypothetical protein BWQ96_05907 [Gracilariopsis chorda]|uniref:Uncharacterized protein n=1 Tax=Gracilariopsis chorda TaxID=448386 RepID=A0A2V3IQI8_9FLOR|nr:hypothetical protein BWQ96_05907 [Gracilariopsis chorda]|eukprot:PXF44343.1 hypothetical protein BWQ96_05907 [Gracilariopsis chorda]